MLRARSPRSALSALAVGALLAGSALAQQFDVTNLVTDDQTANAAQITDPGLLNASGMSYAPTGPFWVSSNGVGTSTPYQVDSLTQATTKLGLTVTVPGGPEGVTGQVFNSAAASGAFNGNLFLFGSVGSHSYLYTANFAAGTIDVYKGSANAPGITGSFEDPNLPAGYAPFNVQNLGNQLYVAYAKRGADGDEERGAGLGFVDVFNLQGHLLARVASGRSLNTPWGLAVAPSSFGALAGDLLVGNFGDGRINVFDPHTHSFIGQVRGTDGQPLAIDGLWAIAPGNEVAAGSSALLYFTAGPDDEKHGLFGVLTTAVPEPSTYVLLLGGMVAIGLRRSIVRPWMHEENCSS